MDPLAFKIERDVEAGVLVASWDDPEGGGITTQAKNLTELAEAIKESVRRHFSAGLRRARSVCILRAIPCCSWRKAAKGFIWSTRLIR